MKSTANGGYPSTVAELQEALKTLQEENKVLVLRNAELEARLAKLEPESPTDEEKSILLHQLQHSTYTALKPSKIAGVGVFALRQIPEGTDPFKCVNERFNLRERFCTFTAGELKAAHVPDQVFEQVQSMFAPLTLDDDYTADRDEHGHIKYGILASGLHALNLSWYLNHSDTPNMGFLDAEDDGSFNSFVAKHTIEQDEELTVDYRHLGEEYYNLVREHNERSIAESVCAQHVEK